MACFINYGLKHGLERSDNLPAARMSNLLDVLDRSYWEYSAT